jgi:hypothetical protein
VVDKKGINQKKKKADKITALNISQFNADVDGERSMRNVCKILRGTVLNIGLMKKG